MKPFLNTEQIKVFSSFFGNMAVAWFVAAFIGPPTLYAALKFFVYGIPSLGISIRLLKGMK